MEGAPHTAKRTTVVLWGAPAPVYKGGEEEAGQQGAHQGEGSPTRIQPHPFFLLLEGEKGKERERKRERGKGVAPPPPCPIRPPLGGVRHPLRAPLSLPYGP